MHNALFPLIVLTNFEFYKFNTENRMMLQLLGVMHFFLIEIWY